MKKITLVISMLVLLCCSCQNKKEQIVIRGAINGGSNEVVRLALITTDGYTMLDSVKMKDGHFEFIIPAKTDEEKARAASPMIYQIFLMPTNSLSTIAKGGDHIDITADAHNMIKTYKATGAEEAVLMWQLDSALRIFVGQTDKLFAVYQHSISDDSVRADIETQYGILLQHHIQFLKHFIQQHPHNMASYIAFYQSYNRRSFFDEYHDLDLLKQITESLKKTYPDNPYIKVMEQKVEMLKFENQQEK